MSSIQTSVLEMDALRDFVVKNLSETLWVGSEAQLEPILGDAGFRQYFRLNTRLPMLAVWAPLETENSLQFCRVSQFLLEHGVRAPKVLAVDLENGFLIVEDFGDRVLLSELNTDCVDGYYSEAMAMLLHMQSADLNEKGAECLPSYDVELLYKEMSLFDDWYLPQLLQLEITAEERTMLEAVKRQLVDSALAQPQVLVHRDFHSRNLLIHGNGSLATIDFQDAVVGPLTYDLVSLLKDCYVRWPKEKVKAWALAYASMAEAAGLVTVESDELFLRSFDWMGMQRHIKVLGIFSRLYLRDKKARYLSDLPTVFEYLIESASAYDEFSAFSEFLAKRVQPLADRFSSSIEGS